MLVEKYGWAIPKKLICIDQSRIYTFSYTARIQKYLAYLQNILAFLTKNHLQAESHKYQGIFLHVIPVRIIAP